MRGQAPSTFPSTARGQRGQAPSTFPSTAPSIRREERMPRWLKKRVRCGSKLRIIENALAGERLNTVCVGAKCPNRGECFSAGTATFMILGARCSRECVFCAVPTGKVETVDENEPRRVARAAAQMGLKHVVVTSPARDDLSDGGAGHFAATIAAAREEVPGAAVEVLVPDFQGRGCDIDTVIASAPDVFNHNMETVKWLYADVRPQADYDRSLRVLARAAGAGLVTKSGFMVGLGESFEDASRLLEDLLGVGCTHVTAGQYLQPTAGNLAVQRYWTPEEFELLAQEARMMGFEAVACGPFVRSSYRAREMILQK